MSSTPTVPRHRRLFRIAAIVLPLILFLAYAVPSAIVAERLTKQDRVALSSSPTNLGLAFEDVSFPSRGDLVNLNGWWIPGTDQETVILVHGLDSVRDDQDKRFLFLAGDLVAAGYNVLLFDLRGHGTSEFARFSLGVNEPRDVLGAIDYSVGRGIPRSSIAIVGFSTGAVSALDAAVQEPALGAVVADGAWPNLRALLDHELPRASGLPPLYNPGIILALQFRYDIVVADAVPEDDVAALAKQQFPTLLIHGTNDRYTSVSSFQRLADALSGISRGEVWVVEGVSHVRAYAGNPTAYLEHLLPFLESTIGSPT